MSKRNLLVPVIFSVALILSAHAACTCGKHSEVKIGGYLGERLNACLEHNVKNVVGPIETAKPVDLTSVSAKDPAIWLAFTAKLRIGMNLETEEGRTPRPVHFCDFASAGNTWQEASLCRVWQRIPGNVMHAPYEAYNVER